MSTAPADPQPLTVHRLPETVDLHPVAARDPAVTSLADLTGHATDVTFSAPTDLGPCEDCVRIHAIAVATVSWPDRDERDGTGQIAVCRDCLGSQVDWLAAGGDLDTRIAVEVPAWTAAEVADELGIPHDDPVIDLLAAEDVTGRPGYLADELAHARRLLTLDDLGMSLRAAMAALLHHDPDLARTVETVLRGAA
jgi:hypothetical protein